MSQRRDSRRMLALYAGVVGLFALILAWWMYFFSRQGTVLLERVAGHGIELTPEQAQAVRHAADGTVRMLLFEGAFLFLLLLAGVMLLLRSLRQEVRLQRQRRDFLSAVTHELKSPIAAARLYLDSLLLDRVPEHKREHYLERVRDELARLGEMTEHLLETARAVRTLSPQDRQRVDLSTLVRESVARCLDRAPDSVTLELHASDEVPVIADPVAIDTIVRNLVANALKYGGEPPRIEVTVSNGNGTARLRVRDHGPGYDGGNVDQLFGAFVRGGDELVRTRPGVGLGLFLVAELARAHGGQVEAHNQEDAGFAVEVRLPAAGGAA